MEEPKRQKSMYVVVDGTIIRIPNRTADTEWQWEQCPAGHFISSKNHWSYHSYADAEPMDVPSLAKDKKALIATGSKWVFDIEVQCPWATEVLNASWGFVSTARVDDLTVQADTEFKIVNKKAKMQMMNEPCLNVVIDGQTGWIPTRWLAFATCQVQGQARTYWRLETEKGEHVRSKRYSNLGSVKSAVRVLCGVVQHQPDSDDTIPEYITGYGNEPSEKFDNWMAVQYDYATDEVIKVEPLDTWYVVNKMKEM